MGERKTLSPILPAFTGRELDNLDNNTLNLMYYRARTYDPQTGRFMQRDPHGINPAGGRYNLFAVIKQYADGISLYEYAKSNGQVHIDPWGLCTFTDLGFRTPEEKHVTDNIYKIIEGQASIDNWIFSLRLERCGWGKWKPVVKEASCSGSYWYSSESARTHELFHVEIFKAHWSAARIKTNSLLKCVCDRAKAECIGHAAYLWDYTYRAHIYLRNAQFEVDEGTISNDIARLTRYYQEALKRAQDKEKECSKM